MTSTNFAINSNCSFMQNSSESKLKLDDAIITSHKVASSCLQENQDSLKSESLDEFHAVNLNEHANLTLEASKTHSIGSSILSWAVNTKASVWASVMILKSVRFWMLLGTPSQNARSEVDKKLNELSGSIHVAKLIHNISPSIAALILDKLISLELHETLDAFLKKENTTFQTLIDVLLPNIYHNFAKSFRDCAEGNDKNKNVSISDVLSHICKIIDKHLPYIKETLEVVEKTADVDKRNGIICHVFAGMVDEFMEIGLPKGVDELPLLNIPFVSKHYWDMLQKKALPLLFYKLYNQLAAPLHESKKEILFDQKGGESLVSLAQLAGEQAAEMLPTIFIETNSVHKENDKGEIQESPISTAIAKSVCSLLNGSDLLRNWFSSWFSKELVGLGENDSPYLKKMWEFIGSYLEPMIIHVCVS
ncbi:MAG TPA: hypothetical protein VGP47_10050, partial [Parachlamydiaceae bacterium]|nr:hypothetical protein [Parachlamydiaceae bacterium]